MKRIILGLLISGAFLGSSLATEDEIVLTIGDEVTWKSVFDAGFRPHHVRDGITRCRQFGVVLGIRVHEGGEVLHFGEGDAWFDLLDDNKLVHMSFYGRENRTVGETEEKTEVFARIFGDHLTKKSVVRRYEATGRIDHRDAVNHARIGDFSIFYSFRDSYDRDEPMLERFSVSLKSKMAKRGKRLDSKIEPPEGYEHISLAPVLDEPNTASDREEEVVVEDRNSPKENSPPDEAEAPERRGMPWWALLIAVIALVGIVWVAFRARLRRPPQ